MAELYRPQSMSGQDKPQIAGCPFASSICKGSSGAMAHLIDLRPAGPQSTTTVLQKVPGPMGRLQLEAGISAGPTAGDHKVATVKAEELVGAEPRELLRPTCQAHSGGVPWRKKETQELECGGKQWLSRSGTRGKAAQRVREKGEPPLAKDGTT